VSIRGHERILQSGTPSVVRDGVNYLNNNNIMHKNYLLFSFFFFTLRVLFDRLLSRFRIGGIYTINTIILYRYRLCVQNGLIVRVSTGEFVLLTPRRDGAGITQYTYM